MAGSLGEIHRHAPGARGTDVVSFSIESEADFRALVTLGETTESLTLDFKVDLAGWKAPVEGVRVKQMKELARDIAQFANSAGGCVLVGIAEASVGPRRVAASLLGVDDVEGRIKWIEQAIQNYLVPSTLAIRILPLDVGGHTIVAINVSAHEHLVWVWDRAAHTMECLRRTNHGKEWLNPDDTERHLLNSSRAIKLAIERVVSQVSGAGRQVELASGLWRRSPLSPLAGDLYQAVPCRVTLGPLREHELELHLSIPDRTTAPVIRIPHGLVREIWPTADQSVGLLLSVRLILTPDDEVAMEPF